MLLALPDGFWTENDGVAAIDALGRSSNVDALNVNGGPLDQLGSRLESLADEQPTRAGILNLLATACAEGYHPTRADLHPDPNAHTVSRYQAAALLVRLAQGGWPENEATKLAQHLGVLHPAGTESRLVGNALAILKHQEMTGPAVETFLSTLYAALPATNWEARRQILNAMQTQQRRHLSRPLP
jgi:hypothetical protein